MSEKKTLHNVWLIQDKVPIDESADNVPVDDSDDSERKPKYFAGLAISEVTGNQVSRFEPLSSATKVYKNEKGAKIGARMADKYYESPFITPVFVEYAEFDVPEEPLKPSTPAPKEPPARTPLSAVPESELGGWIALDKLCGNYPLMLRKKVGTIFRFAIAFSENDIRYLPAEEIFAWTRYFEECTSFVVGRIRNRRIAEGKDPDGADDWKKGSGT